MQMSGGHLLAAGLDGGDTLIYSNPSISAFRSVMSKVYGNNK